MDSIRIIEIGLSLLVFHHAVIKTIKLQFQLFIAVYYCSEFIC